MNEGVFDRRRLCGSKDAQNGERSERFLDCI